MADWWNNVTHAIEAAFSNPGENQGVVNAPIIKNLPDDVQKLTSNDEKTQQKVVMANQKDSDPLFCYIKQVGFVRDQVKPKIKAFAKSELKAKCGEYNATYKDLASNKTLGPLVTSYASSVLSSRNQQGTVPDLTSLLTVEKVCQSNADIKPYLSTTQKKQLDAACTVINTPTVDTMCKAYPTFQSYLKPAQKRQVKAACDVVNTPTADTVCKAYPAFQSYLTPAHTKELTTLCTFVKSDDKMKTMCSLKDTALIRSKLSTSQYKELSIGCGLYNVSKGLANGLCKAKYPSCKSNNCCNELLESSSLPVINGIIHDQVTSYTPQINNQLRQTIPQINNQLQQTVQSNLPSIQTMLQDKVTKVVHPMVTQLKDGIQKADNALGNCWTTPPTKSLNGMCYDLQSKFPSRVCSGRKGCCFALLDDVCK